MLQDAFLAKITRPRPHNVYLRENFFGILDQCRKKPAVSLIAPQGSGKTTLITSYIEVRRLKCLWYQIDPNDKDPAAFFHYLGLAAEKANPGKKIQLPHLTPEYQSGIQTFTKEYFARLYKSLGKNSLIVFDNYQELPAESVLHELVGHALDEIPEGVNIVIISRTALPPVISRLRLLQKMESITWDELRLTSDEIMGIASKRGSRITEQDCRQILARTEGWAAGLVLMLDSKIETAPHKAFDKHNLGAIFNYFAEELLTKFSGEARDFLLKTSVLPVMTAEMAEELTGNRRAASILTDLVDMNYFIQSYFSDQAYYQYHHLFRDFLLDHLKNELDADGLAKIEAKAAGLLAANGRVDDAVRLYQSLGDWERLVAALLKEAPVMLGQGRHQTLSEWLDSVPGHISEENPWLLYWKGSCHLPFDQEKSRSCFEAAFIAMHAGGDPAGTFMSWCGMVEAAVHGFDDLMILDRCIDSLDGLLKEFPRFPSKEIEYRVSLAMFMALSFRAPQHPQVNIWCQKTFDIMEETADPDLAAYISLYLVDYFLWTGNMVRADLVAEKIAKTVDIKSCSPMTVIASKLTEALNHWYHGRVQFCLSAVTEGLKVAETKGVNVFNYFLFGHAAIGLLTSGDVKGAESYIKQMASVLDSSKRLCASYYHHIAACSRLLKKDIPGALEHEEHSLSLAVRLGSPFGEVMSRTGLALLLFEIGERQRASVEITNARELAIRSGSALTEFISYLFEAYFGLVEGDRERTIENLRSAMSLGSKKGFVNFHMWSPDIISRLCVLALNEGMETNYAKKLIVARNIFPEEPPLEVENWPWRIKIYTLGRFQIVRGETSLVFSKKAPRKIMEMLKLIIVLGGKDVPESRILDTLWQDADGDAAHASFTTTLKRLRDLLGYDDAIVLRNGRLTLNQRYCWVDVMAFEHLINLADSRSDAGLDDGAIGYLDKALGLYKAGHNFIDFEDNQWSLMFHERLKSMFVRAVMRLGAHFEKTGEIDDAIAYYKKGIEREPLSENLYQNLMLCMHRHGHDGEALALYRRMAKVFAEVLGIEPSSKTKQIYQSLTAG